MPQNPFELLKQFAMRNVSKSTQMEQENRDLRATAIQDEDTSWRRPVRKGIDAAFDFTRGALADDPAFEGLKGSPARQIGGLSQVLPLGAAMGALLAFQQSLNPRKEE